MKILLIDTCGAIGSVALADSGAETAIVGTASLSGRTASERLVPTIRDLATRHAVGLQSLGAVVVVHGPGSFTGVRVGLSAAKGLCEALNVPLVAISRLAVLAHLAGAPPGTRVLALLDAGRGEFYSALSCDAVCLREALLTRDELLATDGPDVTIVCEPAVAQSVATLAPQIVAEPSAESALPLALLRIQQGDFDDTAAIDANYLRRTDAEIFAKQTLSVSSRPATLAR